MCVGVCGSVGVSGGISLSMDAHMCQEKVLDLWKLEW